MTWLRRRWTPARRRSATSTPSLASAQKPRDRTERLRPSPMTPVRRARRRSTSSFSTTPTAPGDGQQRLERVAREEQADDELLVRGNLLTVGPKQTRRKPQIVDESGRELVLGGGSPTIRRAGAVPERDALLSGGWSCAFTPRFSCGRGSRLPSSCLCHRAPIFTPSLVNPTGRGSAGAQPADPVTISGGCLRGGAIDWLRRPNRRRIWSGGPARCGRCGTRRLSSGTSPGACADQGELHPAVSRLDGCAWRDQLAR